MLGKFGKDIGLVQRWSRVRSSEGQGQVWVSGGSSGRPGGGGS